MKCRRILSKPQTLSQPLWLRDDKIMLTPLISWADLFYPDQHSTSLNEACAQQAGNVSHSGFVSFLPCEWLSFEDIRLSLQRFASYKRSNSKKWKKGFLCKCMFSDGNVT